MEAMAIKEEEETKKEVAEVTIKVVLRVVPEVGAVVPAKVIKVHQCIRKRGLSLRKSKRLKSNNKLKSNILWWNRRKSNLHRHWNKNLTLFLVLEALLPSSNNLLSLHLSKKSQKLKK